MVLQEHQIATIKRELISGNYCFTDIGNKSGSNSTFSMERKRLKAQVLLARKEGSFVIPA